VPTFTSRATDAPSASEILGLRWSDIDLRFNRLTVHRSRWQGKVTTPKSGHARKVSLTRRLSELLRAHRGIGEHEVLFRDDGQRATRSTVSSWMRVAQTAAGLRRTGSLHILRHTFCSHLALAGAPVMTIKELAGHSNLATTERYMHLRQVNKDEAGALLEQAAQRTQERNVRAGEGPSDASASGEILEKAGPGLGSPD
jgi:integrase